jgi:hypothetical protein
MSSKLNPLFVDSTKGFGESVGTRVELSGVSVLAGESVFARIQDKFGRDQIVSLAKEENVYAGRIWLTHQQMITYEFFIEKDGVRVANSVPRQILASHMIIDQWHPQREETSKTENTPAVAEESKPNRETTFSQIFPESQSFGEIIDKWGL